MDRQDIDALLIGALYGELTPADEARLAAHLESHPTDRGALDDLKSARQAVRESRIFELQAEPPQAISALLLQEAHRRAPKRAAVKEEKESWFARFTRSFMAHPAMAAAAMLVLVVSVAGTLYVRKGSDQFAEHTVSQSAPQQHAETERAAEPTTTPSVAADQGAEGSAAFQVGLAEASQEEQKAADKDVASSADELRKRRAETGADRSAPAKKKAATGGIVVTRPERQPKDFESPTSSSRAQAAAPKGKADAFDSASESELAVGGASGAAGPASSGAAPAAPARNAAPPPPSTVATTKSPATAKPSAAPEAAPKAEAAPSDNSLIAWAKSEHNRVISLVSNGKCTEAARRALTISNRVPDYYSQFMATDRRLKNCMAYINAERDADAERSGKARSQKRTTADEAPSTTVK